MVVEDFQVGESRTTHLPLLNTFMCNRRLPQGAAGAPDCLRSRQHITSSLQVRATRAEMPRSSFGFAWQVLDLSHTWEAWRRIYSDLAASAAALHVYAKLHHIPKGQQHDALSNMIEAFEAFQLEIDVGFFPSTSSRSWSRRHS